MRFLTRTTTLSPWTVLLLVLCLCLSVDSTARRTGGRRGGKTHGRSYSNRNNNAQSQATSHQAVQSAPKQAAPPGSLAAATNTNKAHASPAASAPQAPAANPSNIGWNVNGQKPVGPPPAYPGLGHNYAAPGGAPPAYSPYGQRPPGYFQGGATGHAAGYPQQAPHYQQAHNPYMQHGMAGGGQMGGYGAPMGGGYGGGMYGGGNSFGMMGGGGMGMAPGMMMMGYPQKKSSMFSLSNVLTGVALYGMYRSMTGGFGGGGGGYGGGYNNYGPREVHIYDHRENKPTDPNDLKPIMGTLGLPQSVTGEAVVLPAKTMEEIVAQTPVQNVTAADGTIVEDPLPPLPFDNQPKIYFGYGYAYGYQNATVELLSAKDGRKIGSLSSSVPVTVTNSENNGESSATSTIKPTAAPEEVMSSTTGDELRALSTMESPVE